MIVMIDKTMNAILTFSTHKGLALPLPIFIVQVFEHTLSNNVEKLEEKKFKFYFYNSLVQRSSNTLLAM